MTATLRLASGMDFTLTIQAEKNLLQLQVCDDERGICLAFEARDAIDNTRTSQSSRRLYNAVEGNKLLFHEKTRMDVLDNAIELHTCPIDAVSRAPLAGLMVHYRFEVVPGEDAVRIDTWFTHRGPVYAESLSWLRLAPVDCQFRSFQGFAPAYAGELARMKHPMRFPALAIKGIHGWAALLACGEAIWIPSYPDYARDVVDRTEEMRYEGMFAPQALVTGNVDVCMYSSSRPLTATLAFGVGEVVLPKLNERRFPRAEDVAGEIHALHSGVLTAAVALRGDGVSILGMDLTDWSVDRRPAMVSLGRMLLRHVGTGEMTLADAEKGWARASVTQTDKRLCVYLENPEGIEDIALQVEALAVGPNRVEWRTHVLNTNPSYTVLYASYPGVNFHGGDPIAFAPQDSGVIVDHAYARGYQFQGPYPSGFYGTMAYMGLYDPSRTESNGLYVAIHDAGGSRKDMLLSCTTAGEGAMDFAFGAINLGRPANAFELAGVMVWQVFDGDWFDMTCLYRDFVHGHAQWMPRHGRMDSPAWMRDVPLYIMDWMPNDNPDADPIPISIRPEVIPPRDDWYKTPIQLADALGVPMGYHLYNWHWVPFNNDFPHYFPVKEGLVAGVDAMHEHGIYVMPYINGRLWDTKDRRDEDYRYQKEAFAHASKSRDGEADLESYASHEPDGSLAALAAMCPSSWLWRKELLRIVQRLFDEFHMDAVYIDQIAAACVNLCADETHNHLPGNGDWWVRAYRLLMDRLRQEKPEGRGYTTESCAEVYADQFDGFLTWTWIYSNLVPAFPLIYGGYIAMLGRNTNGYKKPDLPYYRYHVAQAVLYGQQIGWINPDLVRVPEKLFFMKRMAGLRYAHRDFFSQGQMLRPPCFTGDLPKIVTDTGMGMSMMFEGDALLAAAWKLENKALLLFVNVGDEDLEGDAAIRWAEYGVRQDSVMKLEGAGEVLRIDARGVRVALPRHEVLVLEAKTE